MAKVITISRFFPSYHPLKGKPTYFVEKFLRSIYYGKTPILNDHFEKLNKDYPYACDFRAELAHPMNFDPKHHTIRAGKRWKDGDMASVRCWSGVPYHSKQIIIAPDVKLKVLDISLRITTVNGKKSNIGAILINDKVWFDWDLLAKNDGLTQEQLTQWFLPNAPFEGQILIWNNEKINYTL